MSRSHPGFRRPCTIGARADSWCRDRISRGAAASSPRICKARRICEAMPARPGLCGPKKAAAQSRLHCFVRGEDAGSVFSDAVAAAPASSAFGGGSATRASLRGGTGICMQSCVVAVGTAAGVSAAGSGPRRCWGSRTVSNASNQARSLCRENRKSVMLMAAPGPCGVPARIVGALPVLAGAATGRGMMRRNGRFGCWNPAAGADRSH